MGEVTETKAQRVERLKHEKNAWEHFDEIREFARKAACRMASISGQGSLGT